MYNFIDVNEASESVVLPSEALRINGDYIEELIPGYRTLNVSGREALSPELDYFETGSRDGSTLNNKRFPARTIIVKYQLIAESSEAFRDAYNQLAYILNVEDAELIFNDESDKYFIGTPSYIGEVEPGVNSVVGEIEFLCVDPFKYSVAEYEVEPENGQFMIGYAGTHKSFPTLEAEFYNEEEVAEDGETVGTLTGAGDCGFVAFFNEKEKIIQLGDPNEEDSEILEGISSQTLINQSFTSQSSWGTTARGLWRANSASGLGELEQTGTMGIGVASPAVYTELPETTGIILTATSKADKPTFTYNISARAYDRTETTVKLDLAITVALGAEESYFGYSLACAVYVNKTWHDIVFRKDSDPTWRGKTGHTKNLTVTVTGLKDTTDSVSGLKFKAYRNDSYGTAGTLKETSCKNLKISKYAASAPETYYLTATNYGTSGSWHAATIMRSVPADKLGELGATDFALSYKQRLSVGDVKKPNDQLGAFQVLLMDDSNMKIAGVRIYKNKSGKNAKVAYYVGDAMYSGKDIDLSYTKFYDKKKATTIDQSCSISKSGNAVTFNMFGGVNLVYRDDAIAESKVTKIVFAFESYADKPALTYNGLYWVKFVKNNCNVFRDIPNKFSANDVLVADCKSGEVTLNGVPAPQLGALGNDWEEFYLKPGLNLIGFAYSSWVADEYAPKLKIRFREVFL